MVKLRPWESLSDLNPLGDQHRMECFRLQGVIVASLWGLGELGGGEGQTGPTAHIVILTSFLFLEAI